MNSVPNLRRIGLSVGMAVLFLLALLAISTITVAADNPTIYQASVDKAAKNTPSIQTASIVTPTTDYTPQTITEFGTYPFTYTVVLHNQAPAITPTVRITVTVDPYLDVDSVNGTLVLPGGTLMPPGGTLLYPENNMIIWTQILTYCQPATLTVTAEGTFDQGTLDLGIDTLTTTVEWDGNRRDMVTRLRLSYKIYLPLVMRNY